MGSTVKGRVGFWVMYIGRELSNNCLSISCCSFPEFYFFFFKGMFSFPSLLMNCFLWGKTSVWISSSKKKKENLSQTVILRVWMLGISFCFPPKVTSGLLQAECTAGGYHGPPVGGSPDAWLFKDAGKNTTWESLVCVCATAVVQRNCARCF